MSTSSVYQTVNDFISEGTRPVNIEALIELLGIELVKRADLDECIAGQIRRLEDGRYQIAVNKNDHYFRRRFTMAHELGHYIYHRHLIEDGVDDDTMYRSTSAGEFFNRNIQPAHETEANRFAASVLMPRDAIMKDWEEHKPDYKTVASLWQVSPQALKIRLGI